MNPWAKHGAPGLQTVQPFGTEITVCGEMGGRRLEALALLGLGITKLSITPAAVGPIKELVRKVDLAAIRLVMDDWLRVPPLSMRAALIGWAAENEIECD